MSNLTQEELDRQSAVPKDVMAFLCLVSITYQVPIRYLLGPTKEEIEKSSVLNRKIGVSHEQT